VNIAKQRLRTSHRLIFVSVALASLLVLAPAGFGQSHWEVKPSDVPSALNAVAFGAGLFVAVGDDGVILTSPDGEVWTRRVSGNIDRLAAIAFGNGRFVVARQNPAAPILTSPDGISWLPGAVTDSNGTPIQNSAFGTVAFGGGRFMAAGPQSQGTVLISTDGLTFHPVNVPQYPDPNRPDGDISSLAYCDGQFFAATSTQGIFSSADGMKWKRRGTGSVIGTDGISKMVLVYVSAATFSVDAGHTFQYAAAPYDRYQNRSSSMRAVCYGAGLFVGVDASSAIWTSERGEYWLGRGYQGTSYDEFRGVAFDGTGRFVAVGWAHALVRALIAVASADPPPPPPPAYTVYRVKDLSNGVFTGEPRSISNSGIIGGSLKGADNKLVGAILRDGIVTTYPDPVYGTYPTAVTSVSDNGAALEVAVGSGFTLGIFLPAEARTFPVGGIYSTAPSINSNGLIAGTYFNYSSTQRGLYRYDGNTGTTVDLGNFGLNKIRATSINDRGDIAGTYSTEDYNEHRFPIQILANGQLTLIPTLGGYFVWDLFMNSSGAITGSSSLPSGPLIINRTHAFLFKDGVTSDIDLLNSEFSQANAINSSGDVVGEFDPVSRAYWQCCGGDAFLYHNGVMYDMKSLLDASGDGWVLWRATGINDNGSIVGQGWFHGDHLEPFLAVPAPGSPAGTQTRFVNVSTRLRTSTGDDALIAGFVLRGGPKRVVVRAIGPGLRQMGFPNLPDLLPDPTLELFNDRGERLAFNDNFTDLPSPDRNEIASYGMSPPYGGSLTTDSVIAALLPEGSYTAVVRGKDGTSGNCLVEVYNVDTDYSPGLLNISTRGPVGTGDNVMIGGFVVRGDRQRRVLVRGIGPSLAQAGVANPLQDPMLEIHDQNEQIAANDDWRSDQEAEILAAGFAPGNDRDAAVILSLWPGSYTAIVRGKANGTGNALVEVYALP
jgi:hypothetical protein